MQSPGHNMVVIGTSAGGMEAIHKLIAQLPAQLPAAILIVQHLGIDSSATFLMQRLGRFTPLTCKVAENQETIREGVVYMAPADHHLLVREKQILVAKGPRENQFRPSIDPLFRSAAAYYGSKVISIILTGFLHDGVAGTYAVQRSGGITLVQDPDDAEFPDLPRNVLRHLQPSHLVPVADMGALLTKLVLQPAANGKAVPKEILFEAQIAERVMTNSQMTSIEDLDKLGNRSAYSCPDCGGGLWELNPKDQVIRYRCHSGHAYTQESLLMGMNSALEETLWVAMRTLEERRNVLLNMANSENGKESRWKLMQQERAEEMKLHIERIRFVLEQSSLSDTQHRRDAEEK